MLFFSLRVFNFNFCKLHLGVDLSAGWDEEFNGPDLQLWLTLLFLTIGFGIETNPYINRVIEGSRYA